MKSKLIHFQNDYRVLLGKYLRGKSDPNGARAFGRRAAASRIEVLDIVRVHEQSMNSEASSLGTSISLGGLVKKAGQFFREVIAPLEENQPGSQQAARRLLKLIQTLDRRTLELTASDRALKKEIARRTSIEAALTQSERHYTEALEESALLQEQLRCLSRQVLSAQEEERKRISRDLHDQVASSLNSINIELGFLRKDAVEKGNIQSRKIVRAQRLVRKSVDVIHAFARDLRPPILDDLGLVPALHSFVRTLSNQTKLRVRLNVAAGIERLDDQRRLALYRVAQEALTNVVKHARASRATVTIRSRNDVISLTIHDNGRSFRVLPLLYTSGSKRLGLLGMRERVEMVGGRFWVTSNRGKGTTVSASVPIESNEENGQPHEPKLRPKPAYGI